MQKVPNSVFWIISLTYRSLLCFRWLNDFIDWLVHTAQIGLNNANRDHEETVAHIQRVHERLDSLQSSQEEAMEELESHLKIKTGSVARALEEHVHSGDFREKLCSWKHEEGPPADPDSWSTTEEEIHKRVQARFSALVAEWEKKSHVVADAITDFTSRVLLKYQEFEQELAELEQQPRVEIRVRSRGTATSADADDFPTIAVAISGLIFLPLNLAASLVGGPATAVVVALEAKHPKALWATSPLWAPFAIVGGILALPAVGLGFGIAALVKKGKKDAENRRINSYIKNRTPELHRVSSEFLDNILSTDAQVIDQYAELVMEPAEECLQQVMKVGIPVMIRAYQDVYNKLKCDERSKEEMKETYGRLMEDCRTVKTKLAGLFPELFVRPPIQVSENT